MNRRKFMASATAAPFVAGSTVLGEPTSLFNGRDLSGWVVEEGPQSAFYVDQGEIVASQSSKYPAWLRSEQQYENFDLRGEFFIRGWIDGGVYFHAPAHGRRTWIGKHLKLFHQENEPPRSNSVGAIFPVVAPRTISVQGGGNWNSFRIYMNWPELKIWINDVLVQDLDLPSTPELRHRPRSGYLGLAGLGYPIRFRNLQIEELPAQETWEELFTRKEDFDQWFVSESEEHAPARFLPLGNVIRAEGGGHLATRKKYRDFELRLYVRGPKEHNGGILLRSAGEGLSGPRHYEIQIHNVEEAHFSTGSLYYHKRAHYPRLQDEEWFPMQIRLAGSRVTVWVNGDEVLDYSELENTRPGHIELQAHRPGSWLEFKDIRLKQI